MISIKFTTHGANAAFGAFGPGDTARVSKELAEHFVEFMKCAKYLKAKPAAEVAADVAEEKVTPRQKGRK